jgi:hypothetical protein
MKACTNVGLALKIGAKTVSDAEMGENYIDHAREIFEEGDDQFQKKRWADAISSFQETIEFCAKAAFYFVGQDYPKDHRLSENEFERLRKSLPSDLQRMPIGRLYLMMEFWSQVRNLAKYGSQTLKVPPKDLFWDSAEATLAKKHAKHAYTLAFLIGKEMGALQGKHLSGDMTSA